MTGEHSSRQYDSDLEVIRTSVLRMGGKVERQLQLALQVFRQGDCVLGEQVIAADAEVNRLEVELDNACTQLIIRRQPIANDLRTVVATMKIITDLERIGDESSKIARTGINLYTRGAVGLVDHAETVRGIGQAAISMLNEALDAMARLDLEQAMRIIALDAELDSDFKGVMRNLITYMMEDPRTISAALDTLWVAKAIERIGDHAKNIAEYVIYVVEGRDIRHNEAKMSPNSQMTSIAPPAPTVPNLPPNSR